MCYRYKVNGEEWRPDCESDFLGCTHTDVQYYKEDGTLLLSVENSNSKTGMYMKAKYLYSIDKEYKLFRDQNTTTRYFEFDSNGNSNRFSLDTLTKNKIILSKLDTVNYLIEGQFEFECVDINNQRVKISNGEFRQKYRF